MASWPPPGGRCGSSRYSSPTASGRACSAAVATPLSGQVLSLDIRAATVAAQVQGSRRTPCLVTVSLPEPTSHQWEAIDATMRAKGGFVARLLAGEVPPELEDVFDSTGVALFPRTWNELRAQCSCPDLNDPCKHVAAVLYVFADQLDADPCLLLAWRGRTSTTFSSRFEGRLPASPPATRWRLVAVHRGQCAPARRPSARVGRCPSGRCRPARRRTRRPRGLGHNRRRGTVSPAGPTRLPAPGHERRRGRRRDRHRQTPAVASWHVRAGRDATQGGRFVAWWAWATRPR